MQQSCRACDGGQAPASTDEHVNTTTPKTTEGRCNEHPGAVQSAYLGRVACAAAAQQPLLHWCRLLLAASQKENTLSLKSRCCRLLPPDATCKGNRNHAGGRSWGSFTFLSVYCSTAAQHAVFTRRLLPLPQKASSCPRQKAGLECIPKTSWLWEKRYHEHDGEHRR